MSGEPLPATPALERAGGARVARLIATFCGAGYAPVAPGKAGSAAALALAYGLRQWLGWDGAQFALLAAGGVLPAMWAAGRVEKESGRRDPPRVVIDEALGLWVTLAGVTSYNWKSWLAAFVLFRAMDIWKPFPVRRLENLRSGAGIIADDLMAGAYAALVLFAGGWFNLY